MVNWMTVAAFFVEIALKIGWKWTLAIIIAGLIYYGVFYFYWDVLVYFFFALANKFFIPE